MAIVRAEYPRPQFVRPLWSNLNEIWEYEMDQGCSGIERKVFNQRHLSGSIQVPFCPESRLSGIGHTDFIRGCWYRRDVDIPDNWLDGRLLLHFGAVNYHSYIYVNGKLAGKHIGGYASFSVDIRDFAHAGVNTITVGAYSDVKDDRQASGKQSSNYASAGCSYTRTTGIWQTVWLEPVAQVYMTDFMLTPDVDNGQLDIRLTLKGNSSIKTVNARAGFDGSDMGMASAVCSGEHVSFKLPLNEVKLWDVGKPNLYDLKLTLSDANGAIDEVDSYFGMRDIHIEGRNVMLNGKPLYQRLVLDQGFNPEGIITAPSDDELRADIERSLAMGFNGARLHQKIFEQRFMYWADHMGYILWGEYPNWGLSVSKADGMPWFINEWLEAVKRDYSSPAIIGWCPFNETEISTDLELLRATYRLTKAFDPSRLCIDTSGWVHCDETDIFDYHDYANDPAVLREHCEAYASAEAGKPFVMLPGLFPYVNRPAPAIISKGQPIFISEFGGIGWVMPTDAELDANLPEKAWGYGANPTTEAEFMTRFKGQIDAVMQTEGICGFCYTQLTDVEQEINGVYTYERVPKFAPEKFHAIMTQKAWNE